MRSLPRTAGSSSISLPSLQIMRIICLGHVVAGGGLRAEDVGLGGELGVGVVLQVQVLGSDVQRVQVLALVLVHTLDLAVKDRIRVNDLAGGLLQVVGKVGLVLTLDLGGGSLVSASQDGANAALLLENGQVCTAVLLDKDLNVQYSGNVPAANQILRRGQNFYLLTDSGVECFAADGVYQWGQELSVRPQALIAGKQLLVLCGNTVQQIAPPEQTASSAR